MFILKNEGATLNLKRSDLLKARAIQNQWLPPWNEQSTNPQLWPYALLTAVPSPRTKATPTDPMPSRGCLTDSARTQVLS